jgi:hypothetical protein
LSSDQQQAQPFVVKVSDQPFIKINSVQAVAISSAGTESGTSRRADKINRSARVGLTVVRLPSRMRAWLTNLIRSAVDHPRRTGGSRQ